MIRYALVAVALATITVGASAQSNLVESVANLESAVQMKVAVVGLKVEAVRVRMGAEQQKVEAAQPAMAGELAAGASPAERWFPNDPADSLYRAARTALNRNDLRRAAQLFSQIPVSYPGSAYIPDALYWEAFSLYRLGGGGDLRRALALLEEQAREHPNAATRRDGDALATRIRGALAQQGDSGAATLVARAAQAAAAPPPPPANRPPPPPSGRPPATPTASRQPQQQGCASEDDDMRLAALNALLHMDSERALPVIRQVLARRDACAAPLREHAVFLLAQKRSPETETMLIDLARNDPDAEIRKNAVFWLSQVPGERSLDFLQDLLRTTNDAEVREQAVFAISQNRSPRGLEILRSLAEQTNLPADLRQNVIFWLGQGSSPESAAFLRSLYSRLETTELKEVALFAISQNQVQGSERWLLDLAGNERESTEMRTRALFWAAQSSAIPASELAALYDRLTSREMKEQALFGLSQRRDPAALDKLIAIARGDPDHELRKRAIFWLGQSREPRAAEAILDMVTAP